MRDQAPRTPPPTLAELRMVDDPTTLAAHLSVVVRESGLVTWHAGRLDLASGRQTFPGVGTFEESLAWDKDGSVTLLRAAHEFRELLELRRR